jgi:hypothetical protein
VFRRAANCSPLDVAFEPTEITNVRASHTLSVGSLVSAGVLRVVVDSFGGGDRARDAFVAEIELRLLSLVSTRMRGSQA